MTDVLPNYRTNNFLLNGYKISIAGMAGLHNSAGGVSEAMRSLKEDENRLVLINLHESENFSTAAERRDLTYYYEPMDDFGKEPLYPAELKKIYDLVIEATANKQQVTISCGSGNGRTGVALASLKLRELIEQEFKQNPSEAVKEAEATEKFITITAASTPGPAVPCTPLVYRAIEIIRNERTTPKDKPNNGIKSVETAIDIKSLIKYENFLRVEIAKELATEQKKASAYDPTFLAAPKDKGPKEDNPISESLTSHQKD